jgi:predicted dehydrogenase
MGGYAVSISDALTESAKRNPEAVQFVAACDPAADSTLKWRADELTGRGVRVLTSMDDLLRLDIDAVWLPVPIDLHRPFAEKAFKAGKAVMCEKPPAGCVQDLDAMARAAADAKLPLLFGYQDIYDGAMLKLKRLLLAGEIGKVKSATVVACWPREAAYYGRNNWAGKLKRGETWVLDSPIMNALAHPVNLTLFLLGATEATAAIPASVEGELYRVNPIENFDTVSVRATLEGGATLTVVLTHACEKTFGPDITIVGETGRASVVNGETTIVHNAKPNEPTQFRRDKGFRTDMARRASQYFRGEPNADVAVATPQIVRSHLILVNGLSEATPVRTISGDVVDVIGVEKGDLRVIRGIEQLVRQCEAENKLFSEVGAPWAGKPGSRDVRSYTAFTSPKQA